MPTKWLPESANLDHLKSQAKDLLKAFRANEKSAFQRLREFHPRLVSVTDDQMPAQILSLSDAQLAIAREYGYPSWPRLKAVIAEKRHEELKLSHNNRLADGPFKQALDFIDAGDEPRLKAQLAAHPDLVHERVTFEGGNYFATPTLLEFIPENPIRQECLPANAVAIAKILLDAGAKDNREAMDETVMLAASGRVCREYAVQEPLIKLLCDYGADPAAGIQSALAHGEFDAAQVLLYCGAQLTLSVAAALDRRADVAAFLAKAPKSELQLALALAANTGRAEVVKMLLAAGADPDQYNPPGGHSHCTPLHSAVAADEYPTVVALVEGGADLTIGDIHHNMTAHGWAVYLKRDEIAAYLAAQ